MDEGAQEDVQFGMEIDNGKTVGSENSSASKDSEEEDDDWKCDLTQIELNGYQVLWSKDNKERTKYAKYAINKDSKVKVGKKRV